MPPRSPPSRPRDRSSSREMAAPRGPCSRRSLPGRSPPRGAKCSNAGVAATPTTGVFVRELRCAGGLQISASHNPAPYNGFKLFSAEGRVLPAQAGEHVVSRYRAAESGWARHDSLGATTQLNDTLSRHLELALATVDVERIRSRKFHVVLDANHGAGALLGKRLLDALGCESTIHGAEPDGQFEHEPEPTAENLAGVLASVPKVGADIGFCQDPDADRLAIIDNRGRYLGEEYTLALAVEHVLATHARKTSPGRSASRPAIVTNCSTSRMSEDIAARHGAAFFRSAVGEANVVDAMLRHDAILGGEGNGGVIHPGVVLVRDSFLSMALVLDAMAASDAAVSELAAQAAAI